MTPIHLQKFVEKHGQEETAKALGSSQAAISKAVRSGRLILVSEIQPGLFQGLELKGFPCGGDRETPRLDLAEILSQIAPNGQSYVPAGDSSSSPGSVAP